MEKLHGEREELLKKYDEVGEFYSEGLIWVKKDGEMFHVSLDGKPAYDERYGYVGDFSEGLAAAHLGIIPGRRMCHIGHNGKPAYPQRYRSAGEFKDGKANVITSTGSFRHIDHNFKLIYEKPFFGRRRKRRESPESK